MNRDQLAVEIDRLFDLLEKHQVQRCDRRRRASGYVLTLCVCM